jgi:hypothetical protein
LAKLAELEKKPASVKRSKEYAVLLLAVIEESPPAEKEWLVNNLLEMVVEAMPVAKRHKFLTKLYKDSLN